MPQVEIGLSEARRIALAAQGFDRQRPKGAADGRAIERVMRKLGVVQLDFVNVLAPAHYLVMFSRLGPYRKDLFDRVAYKAGGFTEQWAHEASIIPVETWPLLRHRMAEHRVRPYGFEKFLSSHDGYARWVLEEVRRRGPLAADDLAAPEGVVWPIPGAWFKSFPRATLEAHFGRGLLAVVERRPDFARIYDLAERVIPAEYFNRRMPGEEQQRELVRRAARALGVGTAGDIADYFRMPVKDARPRINELVETGELEEARVEGWRETAYLDVNAKAPKTIEAAALIAPFDPLIWTRARMARLFQFEYRVEIFVPEAKRKWGYYVLPFLLGERLLARVDLKANRKAGRLEMLGLHHERGDKRGEVNDALREELRKLAGWLGLAPPSAIRS